MKFVFGLLVPIETGEERRDPPSLKLWRIKKRGTCWRFLPGRRVLSLHPTP
jgi:hypothetical protein